MGPFIRRVWDRCRRAAARHRVLAIVIGTVALYGCALSYALPHQVGPLPAGELTIAAVTYAGFAAVAIARWPFWLLVAVPAAGALVTAAAGTPGAMINSVMLVSLLVFSLCRERAPVIAATLGAVGVLGVGYLLFALPPKGSLSDLGLVPWLLVMAAVGQAIRAWRAQKAMLAQQARQVEESRETEARRRIKEQVHAERLRIARDLHDAVGHHVALISVQAGAMSYLLDTDLGKARESLTHIQRASEAALEELRLTVGLLRQPGDSEPVEPAGSLSRLDELIGSFTATGLKVTCEVTGRARPLPEAVDLTAYRVIQESLTNAAKHAAGASAAVRLAYRPDALALTVEDDGPGQSSAGGRAGGEDEGHGIIGMRERAAALGGWASAGPRSGGGFQVKAELPLQAGAAS